jgi:protein disulfide-isomerase A6
MVSIKSLVLATLAATAAAKSAVLDLKPSNFDKVVLQSGKPTLVEFFAPWCGHCKKLAPVYEELATAFHHAGDKVQIAKVDADAEKSLGKRFGIQGFPTLKWFDGVSETPTDYKSGRDLDSLTAFITEKTGAKLKKKQELPSDVTMLTDKTFSDAIGGDKNVLVAFTAPWCGHCKNLAPTWETLATDFVNEPNVVVAKVDADAANSKATAQGEGVTSYPTIKFYPAGSKEAVAYEGGRTESDFLDFLNEKAGTFRTPGGNLNAYAGTVAALDTVVAKLTGASDLAELSAEVKKEVDSLTDAAQLKYAEYYVRVFDKLNSSDSYVAKELARLNNILTKGGLAPSKRDEIERKTNVLRKFAAQVSEKIEEIKDEL